MLNRRHILQLGAGAIGASVIASRSAWAQPGTPVKVRYSEVIHSMFYAPAYVAIGNGFFREAGIEVEMTTANGGDKSMAALLGGTADIALAGPEVPIYVLNGESPDKVRIFSGLTATDGFILMGREKPKEFSWDTLKGKEIMGWRPGSTPLLFLQAALRRKGLDPLKDVKLLNNTAPPARMGAWLSGQGEYAIFAEPDASQLELDGKAYGVASIGQTVGQIDYTAFMATDTWLKANPATVLAWTIAIAKAMKWTATAPTAEVVGSLSPFFPGVSKEALTAGTERYRKLGIWKSSPVIEQAAIDGFQDILVQSGVLEQGKRVKFQDLVISDYARKAI
jgi:NitT/TauT family transport system substrate-binding protein